MRTDRTTAMAATTVLTMLTTAAIVHGGGGVDGRGWIDRLYYVDPNAAAGGNGTSPDVAFRDLQDAIDVINHLSGGDIEVRLSPGTFTPDRGTGDRAKSFHFEPRQLTSGMTVTIRGYGFWPSGSLPVVSSFLSGDLARNDQPGFLNNEENSFTIVDVRQTGLEFHLVFQGVGIVGSHVGINDNVADDRASAVLINRAPNASTSSVRFQDVLLTSHDGVRVSMIRAEDASISMERCEIYGNRQSMWNGQASLVEISSNRYFTLLALNDVDIHDNLTTYGNMITAWGGGAEIGIQESTIDFAGKGSIQTNGSLWAVHSTFRNTRSGGVFVRNGGFERCEFENIGGSDGRALPSIGVSQGALSVYDSAFRVTDPSLRATGVNSDNSSVQIGSCTFTGLSVVPVSPYELNTGSAIRSFGGVLELSGSTFSANTVRSEVGSACGGAVYATNAHVNNCVFLGNSAAGIEAAGGAINLGIGTINACTFHANSASSSIPARAVGGAISAGPGVVVSSCILWNNTDGSGSGSAAQVRQFGTNALPVLVSNTISGYPVMPDLFGNTGADPRFVDALGPDEIAGTADDNLRLLPMSYCIDSGTNAYAGMVPEYVRDVDGNERFLDDPGSLDRGDGSRLDRGACEFQGQSPTTCRRDINLDGVVDIFDLTNLLRWFGLPVPPRYGPDYDGDGVVGTPDLVQLLADFGCVRG